MSQSHSPDTGEGAEEPTTAAIYCRVSTGAQDTESQVDVCTTHAQEHPDIDEWTIYSDVQSGHDDTRDDYVRLKEDIADGQYDYFICSEFSRISRNDGEIKSFVDDCFDRNMGFEVVQASFSVAPDEDAINRQALKIVADTLANISTMENLQKIKRIKRGMHHAREEGKWTRKPPAGFEVHPETKYLQVNVEEFLSIRDALLDHYYNDTPWAGLASTTPVQRTTLSRIYNDEDRRRLYVYGEGWDDWSRDEAALEDAGLPENASPDVASSEDANLKTYLWSLDDAPDCIDPEARREHRRREQAVGDDEQAMLATMRDLASRAENGAEKLSEEELVDLYERNHPDTDASVGE